MNTLNNEILNQLNELYNFCFYDDFMNQINYKNATSITILYEKNNICSWIGKEIKLPKKKKIDLSYITSKIENESIYKNFSSEFKKLLPKNYNCYPTSYGIGVFRLFAVGEIQKEVEKIHEILKSLNIDYSNEFSEASWVYRFKISKSAKNIEKIQNLKIQNET